MINIIVPLAGDNLIKPNGEIKSLKNYEGKPILKSILESRPWYSDRVNYYFALKADDNYQTLYKEYISNWFKNTKAIFLTDSTKGAAMSSLSCISLIEDLSSPLIIDLADISYDVNFDPIHYFKSDKRNGAAAIVFKSSKNKYSYLSFNKDNGDFIESKEKFVISDNASAGTYIYRNISTYMNAMEWFLSSGESYKYNSLYYVCPSLNGVKKQGSKICIFEASNIIDHKF